ncbi:MAG: hypothetical protein V3T53_03905, partial [Phycisphaerales bacterium]
MNTRPASRHARTLSALSALLILNALGINTVNGQEQSIGDAGTLDKESAARLFPAKRPYSPYAGRNFPTRPLFGDTHL